MHGQPNIKCNICVTVRSVPQFQLRVLCRGVGGRLWLVKRKAWGGKWSRPILRYCPTVFRNWDISVGIVTRMRTRPSGIRKPTRAKDVSRPQRSTPALGPVHYSVGTGVFFPGGGGQNDCGLDFTTHIHLLPRLRMGGAVPDRENFALISVVLHFAHLFWYFLSLICRCTVHGIEPSAIYPEGILGCVYPRVAPVVMATLECAGRTNAARHDPSGPLPTQGN